VSKGGLQRWRRVYRSRCTWREVEVSWFVQPREGEAEGKPHGSLWLPREGSGGAGTDHNSGHSPKLPEFKQHLDNALRHRVLILSDSTWSHIWTQWFLLGSFQPGIFSDSMILSDKELCCTASLLHHSDRCMEQSCLLLPWVGCSGEDKTMLGGSVPRQDSGALPDRACHVTAPNRSKCDLLPCLCQSGLAASPLPAVAWGARWKSSDYGFLTFC